MDKDPALTELTSSGTPHNKKIQMHCALSGCWLSGGGVSSKPREESAFAWVSEEEPVWEVF